MPKDGLLFKLKKNLLPLFRGKIILKELGYFKTYYWRKNATFQVRNHFPTINNFSSITLFTPFHNENSFTQKKWRLNGWKYNNEKWKAFVRILFTVLTFQFCIILIHRWYINRILNPTNYSKVWIYFLFKLSYEVEGSSHTRMS